MADRTLVGRRLAIAMAAACLVMAACGRQAGHEAPPVAGDAAVASVDGQTIWASDVKREAVAQGLIAQGEPLEASSDAFRQVLDEVIDQKLLAAEAVRRGLDKGPAAQKRLAAARERVLSDLLVEGVVNKAAGEDRVRQLYQEQVKLSNGQTPITLQAARPQIVRFLTYDQVRDLIETLRAKSKVQVLLKAPAQGGK